MVQDGLEFTVHDAKTNEDITRAVLTQIIVEQEAKTIAAYRVSAAADQFYGDNLQVSFSVHDMTMQSFAHNQEKMRSYMENAFGGMYPFSSFEEVGRKNMAMFEQAINMMTPFNAQENDSTEDPGVDVNTDPLKRWIQ